MTKTEQAKLLALARTTIVAKVNGQPLPEITNPSLTLQSHSGCFVTIKQQGQLRGCIGSFVAQQPLWQTVQEMAVSAATRDPRFYPMTAPDLADFQLEISVLSPLQLIQSIDEIKVGTHGLYLMKGHAHGVLLPQVAVEYGWDRDSFLRHTCMKAGLPETAWKKDCEIHVFSAEVFGED
ncbi:AmmeMemoRadiSam system protein A [bacterium]|nr:AmmeMemoRadiSam system protein A [bacterium]